MLYTIEVSDHPEGMRPLMTQDIAVSWQIVYDGKATISQARELVKTLAEKHQHVRAYRGNATLGRIWLERSKAFA